MKRILINDARRVNLRRAAYILADYSCLKLVKVPKNQMLFKRMEELLKALRQ